MNSEENREELSKDGEKYLLAMRMGSVKEVKEDVLSRAGRYRKIEDNLEAKEVVLGEGESKRRYIVCYNHKEEEREKNHRADVLKYLKKELEKHPNKSSSAKWAMSLFSSKRYKRYLKVENGEITIDEAAVKGAGRYDGKWVLITNDDSLSVEDAARGYKNLYIIERCFRSLKKTQIRMGPVYHWLPRRIEAHIKICVIALLIQRVAELECNRTWREIREVLEKLHVTEFQSKEYNFFQRNELSPALEMIFKKLEVPHPKKILEMNKISARFEN
jgi:transposase